MEQKIVLALKDAALFGMGFLAAVGWAIAYRHATTNREGTLSYWLGILTAAVGLMMLVVVIMIDLGLVL